MDKYRHLYKRYLYNQSKLVFTREQVVHRIKTKFNAKEFPKEDLLDLVNDDQLDYCNIFTCLCIDDPHALLKLYSNKERENHKEEIKDNRENPLNPKKVKKTEWNYNHILMDEQEGRRLDIVMESKNGIYISEFIVRGESERLNRYLNALVVGALIQSGESNYPADISDEYFQFYLDNLEIFGFLN